MKEMVQMAQLGQPESILLEDLMLYKIGVFKVLRCDGQSVERRHLTTIHLSYDPMNFVVQSSSFESDKEQIKLLL